MKETMTPYQEEKKARAIDILLKDYKQELETLTLNELMFHIQAVKKTKEMSDDEWKKLLA